MGEKNSKIGLILASTHSGLALNLWPSFAKTALSQEKSLYIFPGGRLNYHPDSEYLRNPLYSLINNENLDGFIIWSTSIRHKESGEDFEKFHSRFDSLPYVTLTYKIQGHPCLEFDGYLGMKQLITHSITVHKARKIALLRGPENHPYAQARFKGYEAALREEGIPIVSKLVTEPFGWNNGDEAAAQLLEERKLKPGRDFDTLVGTSDLMLLKAINYLSRHGYHMPLDYHALGFNDSVEGRLIECPLSTVKAPYSELSFESFRILDELFANRDGSAGGAPAAGSSEDSSGIEDVVLLSEPVIRESCGCRESYFLSTDADKTALYVDVTKRQNREKSLSTLVAGYLKLNSRETGAFVAPLIRIWYMIEEKPNSFSQFHLELFFRRFEKAMVIFFGFYSDAELVLGLLKNIPQSGFVSPAMFRKFEPGLYRTILKVRERLTVLMAYERENRNAALNSLKCELLGTRDKASLLRNLARYLPKIGINTAGLVLYADGAESLWAGGFSPGGLCPVQEQKFPGKLLVPDPLKETFSQGVFIVQPLFIDNQSLGYFIHSIQGNDGILFEELRSTVSYTLKSIFQFEEVVAAQSKMLEGIEENRLLGLQKEAAQAASEAKSQFLASVSHEIRTPMNAVLGMAQLLLSEDLNRRQRRYVEDIKTSAMILLDIINEILDLSKIQSGKMTLVPVHYDFRALVDNIDSMMRFLIKDKNIAFEAEMRPEMPRHLYGDDLRLRQILLNILSNAVKFTKAGYIHLTVSDTESEIHFTVKDTGIGIKPEDIPLLFESFRQADEVRNRSSRGTGLGLSITKTLVEMMGGRISVESVYGEGSTFHIAIPKVLGDEAQIQLAGPAESILCSPDTRILVVDDNKINLDVCCGLLRLCNVTAVTAESGQEAIEVAGREQYDLIFMDHMMPEMDGIEAARIIREKGIKTPIIALTANAVTSAKDMMLAAGMDDFLAKPIVKEELNGILAKWIPASKHISAQNAGGEAETPPDLSSDFWERINKINGLSMQIGLERVSGQTDLYEKALKLLIKEIEKCVNNLRGFLSGGDLHNFSIEAHSMKSSLANLGVMELSAKAHELELASGRMDAGYCESNLQYFSGALNDLRENIAEAFSGIHKDEGPRIIAPELASILTGLERAFKGMEFEKINDEINKLESLNLDGDLKDDIEEIKDAVMIMDYDSAIKAIRNLLQNKQE